MGRSLCQLISFGFHENLILNTIWENITREEAIRSFEEEGQSSDIRIAITAEHLYGGISLEDVELFDVTLVQAGNPDSLEADPDDPDFHLGIPPLRLILSVPRGLSTTRIEMSTYTKFIRITENN